MGLNKGGEVIAQGSYSDIIKNTISDCKNFLSSSTTDFDLVKVNCPKQKEHK